MLVDHDLLFSAALATLITAGPFQLGPHAANADDALGAIAGGAAPDLIVLALQDGLAEGIAGIGRLRGATQARIVVLADALADRSLSLSLKAGADAYLNKSMSSDSLLRALQLVMLGEVVYPTHVASLLLAAANTRPTLAPPSRIAAAPGGDLSKREIQILRCLLAGQSNKAIARHLLITESTVKMHFKNVMRKINAQNRTQAAVWRFRTGCRRSPPPDPSRPGQRAGSRAGSAGRLPGNIAPIWLLIVAQRSQSEPGAPHHAIPQRVRDPCAGRRRDPRRRRFAPRRRPGPRP